VDVLVLAIGFKVLDVDAGTYTITGSDGRSLADFWRENRMQAYERVSIPRFPNFFCFDGNGDVCCGRPARSRRSCVAAASRSTSISSPRS
jgi:hypothetical protein